MINSRMVYGTLGVLSVALAAALPAAAYFRMQANARGGANAPMARPAGLSNVLAGNADVFGKLERRPWFRSDADNKLPVVADGALADVLAGWRRLEAQVNVTRSLLISDAESPALAQNLETVEQIVGELSAIAKQLREESGGAGRSLLPLVHKRLSTWRTIAIDVQYRTLDGLPETTRMSALRKLLTTAGQDRSLPQGSRAIVEKSVQDLAVLYLRTGATARQRLAGAEEALGYFNTPQAHRAVQDLVRGWLLDRVKPRTMPDISPLWKEATQKRLDRVILGVYTSDPAHGNIFIWRLPGDPKWDKPKYVAVGKKTGDVTRTIDATPKEPFAVSAIRSFNEAARHAHGAALSLDAWQRLATLCNDFERKTAWYRMAAGKGQVSPQSCRAIYEQLSFAAELALAEAVIEQFEARALVFRTPEK